MTSLLVGCEIALYIANRLRAYIEFLRQLSTTLTRTNFKMAVTELYALILGFLAHAIRIYQTSTSHRALLLGKAETIAKPLGQKSVRPRQDSRILLVTTISVTIAHFEKWRMPSCVA